MNKKSLIYEVSMQTGYSQSQVEKIIGPVFKAIKGALNEGGRVTIQGFGSFRVEHKKTEIHGTRIPVSLFLWIQKT